MKQLNISFANIPSLPPEFHVSHNLQSPLVSNCPESTQCFPTANDNNAPSIGLKRQHILHRLFQDLIVFLFDIATMPQFVDTEMKNDTTALY